MSSDEILETLSSAGALVRYTHVVYTSGRHGNSYVNKDALYPNTGLTSKLCEEIAGRFADARVEVVLAPAIGGVVLSQWVAHHLSKKTGREVLAVYAEKSPDESSFILKRGYDRLIAGKRVLLLEDVLTTGSSIRKVVDAAREIGAEIVGLGALFNRGGVTAAGLGGVPVLEALISMSLDSWNADECPLCRTAVPINTEVGKGREFLAKERAARGG